MSDAERVYAAPAHALEAARATLASPAAAPAERAEALWVLGRSAYYANRMAGAVAMLREAAGLAESEELLTEILLTLAPALSKQGHPDEALALLEQPALELEPRFAGQLRNQRAIILTELGRLPEALAQLEAGLALLREAGDTSRECRTLVNLGVVASLMGQLDDAERWYASARDLAVGTAQHVVAAGIEGNLGYVESRRGNFAAALDWYERARSRFAELGDVDLLVAVLETDHARTLLDVGLFGDAADAAERAVRSASAGGNHMLVTQSRLLLAEALFRLGDDRLAEAEVAQAAELAERLGQHQWVLRAASLRAEFGRLPDDDPAGAAEERVTAFLAAGWVREAYDAALSAARALRHVDPARAAALLRDAEQRVVGGDVDPVARALGALLLADLADDPAAAVAAFRQALDAFAEQRDLLGSLEVRTTITQRLVPLREVAVGVALRLGSPDDVLGVLERVRAVRERAAARRAEPLDGASLTRLRSARVAVAEAKLGGGDPRPAAERLRALEREILAGRRVRASPSPERPGAHLAEHVPASDVSYVTFVAHGERVFGLNGGASAQLADLGSRYTLGNLVRAQRAALRRLADARRRDPEGELARLVEIDAELDARLLTPLGLPPGGRLAITPIEALGDITWPALPSCRDRPVVLTPTQAAWSADHLPIDVRRVAVLSGPGITAAELEQIGAHWAARADVSVLPEVTCEQAVGALAESDLVHIAAHGAFRADNPYFSALVFADGHLSLLELAALERLPDVVVLASCDTAAAAGPGGSPDVVVGTATELRRLGARAVVAPALVVNDRHAADMSVAYHRSLCAGSAVDESLTSARAELVATGDPRAAAAAWSFQLFGSASASAPISTAGRA